MITIRQSLAALLAEPEDERKRFAGRLRDIAEAIGDQDRATRESFEDVANVIEYGHRMPRGVSVSYIQGALREYGDLGA